VAVANSSLAIGCTTQLVLKLFWDSKWPASSGFTLGKRKKLAGVISSE
jgi:hypothetical protein